MKNNTIILFILAILASLLISASTIAATYYVDATNGNDSNIGTSQSASWKTIAKVNASNYQPNDFILFKRGEVWREQLNVSSSGSEGKPITFGAFGAGDMPRIIGSNCITEWKNIGYSLWASPDNTINIPGHDNDTGFLLFGQEAQNNVGIRVTTGQADVKSKKNFYYDPIKSRLIIYSEYDPVNYYGKVEVACRYNGINIDKNNYVSIQDLDIRYTISNGIRIYNSNSVSVDSVDLSYLGGYSFNYQGIKPMRAGNAIQIDGNSSNISIFGCHISQIFDFGITPEVNMNTAELISDIIIRNNIIERCGGGIGINSQAGVGSEIRNVYVTNNRITDSGFGWSGTDNSQHGSGINMTQRTSPIPDRIHDIYVEGNVIEGYAWAGIQFYQCGPIFVRKNIIRGGAGTYSEGTYKPPAAIWILGTGYQNASAAFIGIFSYNLVYNNMGSGLFIINNTSSDINYPVNGVKIFNNVFYSNGNGDYPNINVMNSNNNLLRNNIIYSTNSLTLNMQYNTGIESDYNIFYRNQGPMIQRYTNSYSMSQFSAYKAALGQDSHSISTNPLLTDPSNGKFQLQSESPAIDAGIDVGLHEDIIGTPVPQGEVVDIGAYESTLLYNYLKPITNLRVITK